MKILAIILPAYNEEKTLTQVLKSLPKKLPKIDKIITIVVNDGSTDKTESIAREYADYCLTHHFNLGAGAAVITGIKTAKKLKVDYALTFDSDGQHYPNDIKTMLEPITDERADVVIGSRMKDLKNMPSIKVFGNWLFNFITYFIFQQWTTDSQSGLRAFTYKAISQLELYSTGYEISSEIIGEIKRNKLKLVEAPIRSIYSHYSILKGQNWLNGINVLTKSIFIRLTR